VTRLLRTPFDLDHPSIGQHVIPGSCSAGSSSRAAIGRRRTRSPPPTDDLAPGDETLVWITAPRPAMIEARIVSARPHEEHEPVLLLAMADPSPSTAAARRSPCSLTSVPCVVTPVRPADGPTVDVPDPLAGEMRVQLGRGDTRMSRATPGRPASRPRPQEMGRERVAQRVRADLARRARRERGVGTARPGLLARQAPAAVAEEQRTAARRLDVCRWPEPRAAPSIQVTSRRGPRRRSARAAPCRPCR
jgi:hypothetical protein